MERKEISTAAAEISARARDDLSALVFISSPTGDNVAAERMVVALTAMLPPDVESERLQTSTEGCAPDLLVRLRGRGRGRLLLLGHLDTVILHDQHQPLREDDEIWHGSGVYDMKGGLVIAAGLMRVLASRPELYEEILFLVTADEEVRETHLEHSEAIWAQADAVLCFEGGEQHGGKDAVVVRRKSASSLIVRAHGKASHSGTSIAEGSSALGALAQLVSRLTLLAIDDDEELSVTPVQLHAGDAINIVPGSGYLRCDVRAFNTETTLRLPALVPEEIDGVRLETELVERFPAMDARVATEPLVRASEELLGRELLSVSRGGSSDANFFAGRIPVVIDGLGPLGGGDHGPQEFVRGSSFLSRSEVAIALALVALYSSSGDPLGEFGWVRKG